MADEYMMFVQVAFLHLGVLFLAGLMHLDQTDCTLNQFMLLLLVGTDDVL